MKSHRSLLALVAAAAFAATPSSTLAKEGAITVTVTHDLAIARPAETIAVSWVILFNSSASPDSMISSKQVPFLQRSSGCGPDSVPPPADGT